MHDGSSPERSADIHADIEPPARPRRKGIYVLPNLFTLAALFGGFYAIVMAMNGRFENAAIGVFCAMVLDSLDGRVARMTNTQSAFGEQMDSLSDMVSFGAAPALIVYEWALKGLGKVGWLAAFIYCAAAALRLARFNTNIAVVDKRFFQGLPSPAAAAIVTGLIWVMDDAGYTRVQSIEWLAWTACVTTIYAGLTMVTNVPFYSFKDVSLKRSVPFVVLVVICLAFSLIAYHPPVVLFSVFVLYGMSGYAVYIYKRAKGKPVSVIATSTDEPDEQGLHR
jgi:CDP-diacylglycerol--serine O-phosphatidyltransferase